MWLLLCVLGGGIEPPATTDHFAACEINHYYDEHGKHVFDQIIFRDLDSIRDWRLVKHPDQIPTGRKAIWVDGACLRTVTSTSVYHTWTQAGVTGDPELNERAILPKEQRRQLSRALNLKEAKKKCK